MNKVKFADSADIPQILALGYKSLDENELRDLAPDNFDKALVSLTDSVMEHVVLVKRNEEDQRLVDGVLALRFGRVWWSDKVFLQTQLFYIKPEKRSYKLAREFLQFVKEYGIIHNVPIVFDLFAQKDVKKKIKLLKYMGFKEIGSSLILFPSSKE